MINRSKRPKFKLTQNINLPQIYSIELNNQVPFNYINDKRQEIIHIILNFKAGSWYQPKPLVASTTIDTITEGTRTKTSEEIAQLLDYYAVFWKTKRTNHYSFIDIKVLNKNLEAALQIFQEILTEATFPEDEIKLYLFNEKQDYIIDLEEVETQARILFHSAVYGKKHPYGASAKLEDFDNVQRQDVIEFYDTYYNRKNLHIFAGGYVDDKAIKLINKYLTTIKDGTPAREIKYKFEPQEEKYIYKAKEDSLQSAIFIGNKTINHNHPDYFYLYFTNYLLGGYFGSRLMQNIREEKGLTYSIWSYLTSYIYSGEIAIEASVKKENKDLVLEEIRKEIKKLREKGATPQEIKTVQNVALSNLLRLIDGIFSINSYLAQLYRLNTGISYFQRYIDTVNNIDNKKIIEIANKYLCFDDFYKVVVG